MSKITLYEAGTTRAVRCHWMLREIGLEYKSETLSFKSGDHKKLSYLAINPFGKLPALVDNGVPIFESMAICYYLCEAYGKKFLATPGTPESAKMHQWVFVAVTEVEANLWQREKNIWRYPEKFRSEAALEAATYEITQTLATIEKRFEGPYLIGKAFSVADVAMGYALRWARARELLTEYKALNAYLDRLIERPAFPREKYQT